VKKRLVLLEAFLAMLLVVAATAGMARPEDEVRCLLPEGCDTNGDGVPDLRAGEPAPGGGAGVVQYDSAR
jgi:hypothetical protein